MKTTSITQNTENSIQTVTLLHESGELKVTEKISLSANDSFFHVKVSATLPGKTPKLDYLASAYVFQATGEPDFVHTPAVKFDDPRSGLGKDQVIGDRAFHSPAVIIEKDKLFAALVPDLELINSYKVLSPDARRSNFYQNKSPFGIDVPDDRISMPTALDLNLHSGQSSMPVITYGMMDAKIGFHTRFVRDEKDTQMVRTLLSPDIVYGFDLFINANALQADYDHIASHLWEKYGSVEFNKAPQLPMPYVDYVNMVKQAVFKPILNKDGGPVNTPAGIMDLPVNGYENDGSWLEWKNGNVKIGGFRCAAPFWYDVINNTVFWNQAREATSMYYWGKALKDSFLINKARAMINFCLDAPRNEHGLFSTVYDATTRSWGIGWTDPPNNENKLFLKNSKSYEIPALCKTGAHMLDYYQRAEADKRIVDYLTPFADWLLSVIDDRGIVPSYITTDMKSSQIMYETAHPAAALWFLAEMYNVTKTEKYLSSAEKIAGYIEREIIPTAKWIDMEQYISCGAKPYSMEKDYWQDQWFRGTLCTIWACEGFASLHRATGEQRWLQDGEKCIDYLSFSQACWNPHFIYSAKPLGGFNTDNADVAVMMDQRQAENARSYLYFGKALGRKDLLERGIAAGQAGCELITEQRHIDNGITPSPLFYPEGLAPENIDHEGICQWPMRTHALWGEGSAVFTGLGEIYRSLGGLYADPKSNITVAADGLKIDTVIKKERQIDIIVEGFLSPKFLKHAWESEYSSKVKLVNANNFEIEINGTPVKQNSEDEFNALVSSNGVVLISHSTTD